MKYKKPAVSEGVIRAVQRKKKKPLAERIAEKEAARLAAEEKEVSYVIKGTKTVKESFQTNRGQSFTASLTLIMLNKLRCHTHF